MDDYSSEFNSSYTDYYDILEGNYTFEESDERSACDVIRFSWSEANPGVQEEVCPPYWDRISCWPATLRGYHAVIPCLEDLNGILYDTTYNASLLCQEDGSWANKSDYSNCRQLGIPEPPISSNAISIIYFCGHSLSLVALIIAFSICLYFKEMRCLRNKIHSNLFLTYILADSFWILTAVMQDVYFSHNNVEFSWCVSLVFLRYFHLATFFWMFVEGLYLFVQVIAAFLVENTNMKLRHYMLIGWGIPLLVVSLWAGLTYQRSDGNFLPSNHSAQTELNVPGCPFIEKSSTEWVYIVPVFLLLATNTFFLLSIFYVVVTKLRSTGRGEPDHQNWKAAKALFVIIPLLGITYLITILGPTDTSTLSFLIFEHVRAVLLSTQGFTVTLPYCFLNTEVKGIVRHNWSRWRAARSVEVNYSRGQSARNSITMAGYYACDSNATNMSNSRRNSFFRLHNKYSYSQPGPKSQVHTSVILERGGAGSGHTIIPVIQEEGDYERPTTTLISITPATPVASSPVSEDVAGQHSPHGSLRKNASMPESSNASQKRVNRAIVHQRYMEPSVRKSSNMSSVRKLNKFESMEMNGLTGDVEEEIVGFLDRSQDKGESSNDICPVDTEESTFISREVTSSADSPSRGDTFLSEPTFVAFKEKPTPTQEGLDTFNDTTKEEDPPL